MISTALGLRSLIVTHTALLEFYAFAAEDVECTANGKIYLTVAQLLYEFQVCNIASAACICYRNT